MKRPESSPMYWAFNLGQLLGLHGLAGLIPLLAIWAAAAFLWVRINRAPQHVK